MRLDFSIYYTLRYSSQSMYIGRKITEKAFIERSSQYLVCFLGFQFSYFIALNFNFIVQ